MRDFAWERDVGVGWGSRSEEVVSFCFWSGERVGGGVLHGRESVCSVIKGIVTVRADS